MRGRCATNRRRPHSGKDFYRRRIFLAFYWRAIRAWRMLQCWFDSLPLEFPRAKEFSARKKKAAQWKSIPNWSNKFRLSIARRTHHRFSFRFSFLFRPHRGVCRGESCMDEWKWLKYWLRPWHYYRQVVLSFTRIIFHEPAPYIASRPRHVEKLLRSRTRCRNYRRPASYLH